MVCLLAGGLSPPAAAQCGYLFTQIPNPPGLEVRCAAQDINNRGEVAGYVVSLADTRRAFFWSEATGTVVLPFPPGIHDMTAVGINDQGLVVGQVVDGGTRLGFVWDGETYTFIPPPPWAHWVEPSGITNGGQVAGTVRNVLTGPVQPFICTDGVMTVLDIAAGSYSTHAEAINERGEIAGFGYVAKGSAGIAHALTFDTDGYHWLPEPEGFRSSVTRALNNNGFVVGHGKPPPRDPWTEGLVWGPDGLLRVAHLPNSDTHLYDVNDAGRVVGEYYSAGGYSIVWEAGQATRLRDLVLNDAPQWFSSARAINTSGQIIVGASFGSGVLNPVWLAGDLTGDCQVTLDDLAIVLSNFGSPPGTFPRGDVNTDGEVDLTDLAILLTHWGE